MIAVHALLFGIALIEELGCDLREHCVGQHVLFLRCPLGSFGLQLVHFGSQRIGKAAGDGLLVTKEFKGLVHGDYGKTPAPIKPEFTKKILGDEQPITCRFADTLAPEMDKLKAEAAKWATQEEDVLTYAMFPQVAPKFFEKRNAKKQGVDADHADYTNQSHPV